jgi:hypothetical protein
MGRVATVIGVESDGDVKCDTGGDDSFVADHFQDSGVDAPPMAGDSVATVDGPETGTQQVTGYNDPNNESTVQPGERRTYARDADGELIAEVYLQRDGTVLIRNIAGGSKIELKADGSAVINDKATIAFDGEVTAKSDSASTSVGLTTHLTPSPMGPLGPPTPGT